MNSQFLIAKLAATATDTAWSQAYSTLNFYVTISVKLDTSAENSPEESLAQIGKELLERLQREYFSLDEKTLESIKTAVSTTVDSVPPSIVYSLVLVTNNASTLYIVTAGEGAVIIKRGEKVGAIATGKKDTVLSFSGPLKNNDLVVVQTQDFSSKIETPLLASLLDSLSVTDISENIAPHLHNDPSGAEAAIILLYTNPEAQTLEEEQGNTDEAEETTDDTREKEEIEPSSTLEKEEEPSTHLSAPLFEDEEKDKQSKRSLSFSGVTDFISILKKNRKQLLGLIIIVLVIGLVGSIFLQTRNKESQQNNEAIAQAVTSAQSAYEEGEALEPLNRPLALEKFTKAQETLTETKNRYPNEKGLDSLNVLLSKVEQKLSQFSSGKKVENGKKLTSASDIDIDDIRTVSIKGGNLFVTDKSHTLVTLSKDGKKDKSFTLDSSSIFDVNANSDFAFVLTNEGVTRVDLGNGSDNQLVDLDNSRQSIDVYGSNIYLLNIKDKMIEKYAPSSYNESDYLSNPLQSPPVSMTIDGSIYVLYDNGKIGKFTKGADDGFTLTGFQGTIGKKSYIYKEEDFSNLYILDTSNQRILVASSNGEVKQEFTWDIFKDAVDFSVDEKNKVIYIVTSQDLYSFSF